MSETNQITNTQKLVSNTKDLLQRTSVNFDKINDIYSDFWLSPIGEQISDENGNSIRFSIKRTEALELKSYITNYTTESSLFKDDRYIDNLQTNISLQPITLTLTGYIGENVIEKPRVNKVNKVLQSKLNPLNNFINGYQTNKVQEYLNKMQELQEKVDSVINKVGSAIGYLQNLTNTNMSLYQKKVVSELYNLWASKTLVNANTDFCFYKNMAIESLSVRQEEQSSDFVSIDITLKQITVAQTIAKFYGKRRGSECCRARIEEKNNGEKTGKKDMSKWKLFTETFKTVLKMTF